MGLLPPLQFVRQIERRVIRHRRAHFLLIFLPPLLASLVAGFLAPSLPLIPSLFFSPFFLLTALFGLWLVLALSFAPRRVGNMDEVARLIDKKIQGKERFLTLVTLPNSQTSNPLHPLLEQDTAQKASLLVPAHDILFVLDKKKITASLLGSGLMLALAFFIPVFMPASTFVATAEELEQTASLLPQKYKEEVEEQLLSLAQDLRSSDLSSQEKLQRFAKVRKQLSVKLADEHDKPSWQIKLPDLPLPKLLPLDLQSKGQEKEGAGQGEQLQDQPQAQADQKEGSEGQNQKGTSGTGQQEQNQQGREEKPDPQQQGGSIQFDFPQEQEGQEKPAKGPQKPGQGSADALAQAQEGGGSGQDPNRLGQRSNQDPSIDSQSNETSDSSPDRQPGGIGKTNDTSGNSGEHYYQPGEGPAGFLTKDAKFVKVRVPRGVESQGQGGRRVPSTQKTAPLIPYSNAPLPAAGPPGQAQIKQPIPLEYLTILKE